MSVDGYPADMSIFCNLQLGLMKLQEDTLQADIDQDDVSLAGVLQGAVAAELVAQSDTPCSRCWAIIRGFLRRDGDTIACVADGYAVGTRRNAVFLILQRLVDADFAAVEIGFYAQCWSCFSGTQSGRVGTPFS